MKGIFAFGFAGFALILVLGACTPMTGHDPTARTAPPGNDRFARVWCEATLPGGDLMSCGSVRSPTAQLGESCKCTAPGESFVLVGRVVTRPKAGTMSAASPAYTEDR